MAKPGYKLIAALTVAALSVAFAEEAKAQRAANPNLGHFYMARQQIQITDDAPIIHYKGGGAPGQPGAQAPNRPMPLPKAGFQRFSHQLPSYSNSLPSVNNGVPRQAPPPPRNSSPKGNKGKAGKWKAPKKTVAKKKPTVQSLKSYSPYKGYDPKTTSHKTAAGSSPAHAAAGHTTKTNVRGSVLHWSRGGHK